MGSAVNTLRLEPGWWYVLFLGFLQDLWTVPKNVSL